MKLTTLKKGERGKREDTRKSSKGGIAGKGKLSPQLPPERDKKPSALRLATLKTQK